MATWKKAVASYESALKLNAKDADAIFNRDLVKRKLADARAPAKAETERE